MRSDRTPVDGFELTWTDGTRPGEDARAGHNCFVAAGEEANAAALDFLGRVDSQLDSSLIPS